MPTRLAVRDFTGAEFFEIVLAPSLLRTVYDSGARRPEENFMLRVPVISRVGLLVSTAVALPALAACLEHPLKQVEYEKTSVDDDNIALTVNKDVDILFVIDNSGSMAEEQATLASNFPSFISVLEEDNVKANYRIGVTTTDNGNPWCSGGQGGALRMSSCQQRLQEFIYAQGTPIEVDARNEACLDVCQHDTITTTPTTTEEDDSAAARPWLESIEGATNIADGISPAEAFQCIGPQGINGCGFESHLESMFKALRRMETSSENQFGFLRRNAILAVVHVTDEADCSYVNEHASIFSADGERAFWSDPAASQPTSAVCWNAGVTCAGGPTYTSCDPANRNESGDLDDSDPVLHPVSRYTSLLAEKEADKQSRNPNQEVLVGVIAGVPPGYSRGEADILYQDSQADMQFQQDYGIGPGCESAAGKAIPPVRLRDFAKAFEVAGRPNMFSICNANYSEALRAIADTIADQVKPACFPRCVADTDPATPELDPLCTVTEEIPNDNGFDQVDIPACDVDVGADTWDFPAGDAEACYRLLIDDSNPGGTGVDDMSQECVDEGWNLEFAIERKPGTRAIGGSAVKATCKLSENRDIDCPNL